ncbi:ArnT family glycosyltransferase [Kiritimatiella glycovorans]|uniref:Undecaprenyl phosphate-alpha-4-amino-4-deoxy-L-arabinose arabinosyl transferase n=1 Tax=Kiritimatiella glycovorans TaxID=1307763 RepID=A0A0G3EKH1_9BACT|nr:glycosyltransferase family 39 protein [Kiritimatiella glycovorans]AKJ64674.1 Undecaprenyl phosphate-alpha-4-amino-4-deoxy-L-arabinose arabinosyl transferase [Kiritimatiella glycovorans]
MVAKRSKRLPDARGPLAAALLALILLLPGTFSFPLIDRDEPRFAHATQEMLQRGTLTVPYFNGEYRFDKPPLAYWAMMPLYRAFGMHEGTARLPTVLAAAATAAAIFAFGRRLFSVKAGVWAALGWMTCLQTQIHGRICTADMGVILTVVLAHRAFYELMFGERQRRWGFWFWTLYLSVAAGILAKWVVTPAVLAGTILLFCAFTRRIRYPWHRLQPFSGAAVVLAPVAAWAVPALIATDGLFWSQGFGTHVIDRAAEPFNNRNGSPLFYLGTAFLSLFPWITWAGDGASALRRNWDAKRAFLAAWLAGPYVMFTFASTQLPHYVMPAFPAFFLILFQSPPTGRRSWWFRGTFVLYATLLAGAAWVLLSVRYAPAFAPLRAIAVTVLVTLASWLLLASAAREKKIPSLTLAALIPALAFGMLGREMRTVAHPLTMKRLFELAPATARYTAWSYTEPSLVFYADHRWDWSKNAEALERQLNRSGSLVAVFPVREYDFDDTLRAIATGQSIEPSRDREAQAMEWMTAPSLQWYRVSGVNMGRSSWMEFAVGVRVDPRGDRSMFVHSAPAMPHGPR